MAYTKQQISDFIAQKGIGNDPNQIYHAARAYGVTGPELDAAMGWAAGTADQWVSQNGRNPLTSTVTQPLPTGAQTMPGLPVAAGTNMTPQGPQQQQTHSGGLPANPFAGQQQQNPYMPQQQTATPAPAPAPGAPAPASGGLTQNPYLGGIADDITRRTTNNLTRNILPQIGRNSVAAGGYGGSRQGIAEGLAMSETSDALAGQLANLYGTQFNSDRNYGLQSDALDLNVYNANQGWTRQGQQDQINLLGNLLGWNQNAIGNATTAQNTPMNYWQQFGNTGAQLGGLGGTNSQNMQGNPYLSAIGGAMTGYNLWKNWGG